MLCLPTNPGNKNVHATGQKAGEIKRGRSGVSANHRTGLNRNENEYAKETETTSFKISGSYRGIFYDYGRDRTGALAHEFGHEVRPIRKTWLRCHGNISGDFCLVLLASLRWHLPRWRFFGLIRFDTTPHVMVSWCRTIQVRFGVILFGIMAVTNSAAGGYDNNTHPKARGLQVCFVNS